MRSQDISLLNAVLESNGKVQNIKKMCYYRFLGNKSFTYINVLYLLKDIDKWVGTIGKE